MPLPGVSGLGREYSQALGWSVLGTLGTHGPCGRNGEPGEGSGQ